MTEHPEHTYDRRVRTVSIFPVEEISERGVGWNEATFAGFPADVVRHLRLGQEYGFETIQGSRVVGVRYHGINGGAWIWRLSDQDIDDQDADRRGGV